MKIPRVVSLILLAIIIAAGCSKQIPPDLSATGAIPAVDPRACVGRVRTNMTIDQVTAELGAPDRNTESALLYRRHGIEIVFAKDGIVRSVICGDENGPESPMVRAFKGRTAEGIGLGSTRAELVQTYGEPTKSEHTSKHEVLWYKPKGFVFMLGGGKVECIHVDLRNVNSPEQ